jgi:carbon starvation protein CstA
MELSRLRRGELLAAGGGVALLVVMFLDWYSVGGVDGVRSQGVTAWQSFGVLDVILALVALLAIALAVITSAQRSPALPAATAVITSAAGMLAALLVLYRILNQPGPNDFVEVSYGAFAGFLCVAAIAAGGWDAMSEDDPPFDVSGGELDDRVPARPAPPVAAPAQPAPPPEAEPSSEPPA